jgi:hypothetical protein
MRMNISAVSFLPRFCSDCCVRVISIANASGNINPGKNSISGIHNTALFAVKLEELREALFRRLVRLPPFYMTPGNQSTEQASFPSQNLFAKDRSVRNASLKGRRRASEIANEETSWPPLKTKPSKTFVLF